MTRIKKNRWKEYSRIFDGATLSAFKPTAIYALYELKEVQAVCGTKFDPAHPKLSMKAFIYGSTPKDEHYFKGRRTSINFRIYPEE